jgi:hypothetical protein
MSDISNPADRQKLPTGKLGQPTADTAIERATSAVAASKALSENGPQITRPAADLVTPSVSAEDAMQAAAPFIDLYRNTARMSADHLQSLCTTWISLGRGARDMQLNWLDTIASSATVTPVWWDVQRDLYVRSLDGMLDTASRMVDLATRNLSSEASR